MSSSSTTSSKEMYPGEVYGEDAYWPGAINYPPFEPCEYGGICYPADDVPGLDEVYLDRIYPVYGPPWEEETEAFVYMAPEGEYQEEGLDEAKSSPSESVETERPEEERRRSIFVHSCPAHFSEINRARKSVFGSIFLRTTGRFNEEAAILRTIADTNYSMLQSLLTSFEKIMMAVPTDIEKTRLLREYKESILKMLEQQGIRKTFIDGSVNWDIYPIAQSYLFSIQVGDNLHQTRNLSKIEKRIMSGSIQTTRGPYDWATRSVWSGTWDSLGMSGPGTYAMPHGVVYTGKMKDGVFHDDNATLTYPNKFKAINCVYENGILIDCKFQFPDLLMHEKKNWKYCIMPDRRFWSEVRRGLKPGKIAQKTEVDPPRKIPPGCYDTNDGFYNPKTYALNSQTGEMMRVPVYDESLWIKKYCRKGFTEPTGFRPDLYENWYSFDRVFINKILDMHEQYRNKKITYEQLQQFYANENMLPSFSKYHKRLSADKEATVIALKQSPPPSKLIRNEKHRTVHNLSQMCKVPLENEETGTGIQERGASFKSTTSKKSKSFIKFSRDPSVKASALALHSRSSKFSTRFSSESIRSDVTDVVGKQIPDIYLQPQPILRPPFMVPDRRRRGKPPKPKCLTSELEQPSTMFLDGILGATQKTFVQKKRIRKFVKELIMELATKAILDERERDMKRLKWASKVPHKEFVRDSENERCMHLLEELFQSIPDTEEYCSLETDSSLDLKLLAEDKYNTLKYWGKRMLFLTFEKA